MQFGRQRQLMDFRVANGYSINPVDDSCEILSWNKGFRRRNFGTLPALNKETLLMQV